MLKKTALFLRDGFPKVLDLAVTKEGDPSLGRDGSTYQEYIVPAFLTQVKPTTHPKAGS